MKKTTAAENRASVTDAFAEAWRCLQARAPNAAAMMCRRVISNLAIACGAEPGTTTGPQLRWLKDRRVVNEGLFEAAHQVKAFGDEAAHPPDEVTMAEAENAYRITERIVTYAFGRQGRIPR
ncbi:MAG: DUF4145 domain-containing protein [Thermaerobacterales bacterium]